MSLTQAEWDVERAKLVQAQGEIQAVIDSIDAAFAEPAPSGTAWDRSGVANTPAFSNGDRTVAATAAHVLRATVSAAAKKRHFEVGIDAVGNAGYLAVGVIRDAQSISSPPISLAAVPAGMWLWRSDTWAANGGAAFQVGSSWGSGDPIGVTWDDQGRLWFWRNGVPIQGDPETGVNPVFTGLTGSLSACLCFMGANGAPVATGHFEAVQHPAPAGFSLLETL